jgi:hypothetical protein
VADAPLIGIDIGTSGVKGIAISPRGEVLALAEESYPLSTPHPGWSEQDPEDWWRATQACLARLPDGPIGFSGQMHGLVTLDAAQQPLRPAILWNDQRTAEECAEIEERVGLARLIELHRANYGANGERLGFDLYPYTEDAVGAVKRSVLQWNFIEGVAKKIDGDELRKAQQNKDAVRAYELVYAALGA